ncbi:uncharacterized protein LOC128228836 [Mya arenaria]|uniref:uncharacterized protein LOC128228836 n=1 Tax=Mya arenaria TaxID=6604 RepID=UPI0022E5E131|nr:uncharacterized protein LOC128228836 [Mya arenaria]
MNLLNSITKSFQRSNSQKDAPLGENHKRAEQEDDGFLLVGNTTTERASYQSSHYQGGSQQFQSPTLDATQWPGLSSSEPLQTGSTTVPNVSSRSYSSQETTQSKQHINPLTGVPFHLNKACLAAISNCDNYDYLQQRQFDFVKYSYDFSVERALLKEHGEDNESMEYAY